MRIPISNKNLQETFNLNTNLIHNKLTIKKAPKRFQTLQKNQINKLKNKNLINIHTKFNNNYMNKNKYIINKTLNITRTLLNKISN